MAVFLSRNIFHTFVPGFLLGGVPVDLVARSIVEKLIRCEGFVREGFGTCSRRQVETEAQKNVIIWLAIDILRGLQNFEK